MAVSITGSTCPNCLDDVVIKRGGSFNDLAQTGAEAFDRNAAESTIADLPIDELRDADRLPQLELPATVVIVGVSYRDGREERAAVPIGRISYAAIRRLQNWTGYADWQATLVIMKRRWQALRDAFDRGGFRSITFESLGCYGWCPLYSASFRSDGSATIHDRGRNCDITAKAFVPFGRIVAAASSAGASRLRPVYPIQASDTFGARITLRTAKTTFVSEGRDRTSWDQVFLATQSRLDQIVRDTKWSPAVDLGRCAGGPNVGATTHAQRNPRASRPGL